VLATLVNGQDINILAGKLLNFPAGIDFILEKSLFNAEMEAYKTCKRR
jgi:hypothetical protein